MEYDLLYVREQRKRFTIEAASKGEALNKAAAYVAELPDGWDESDDPGELYIESKDGEAKS